MSKTLSFITNVTVECKHYVVLRRGCCQPTRDAYAHRRIHRYMLWKANDALDLYVSCVALGLSMGLSEAPILTYVGETVEPRLRGPLSSVSTFTIMLGSFVAYLMSTVLPWRTVALINISVPIVSFVAVVLLVRMTCLHDSSWLLVL